MARVTIGSKPLRLEGVHRFIEVQVDNRVNGVDIVSVLPDTGAYLTTINKRALKDSKYKIVSEQQPLMEVGGVSVSWKLAVLERMYIGKLQLFDVHFALAENNEINLLGTNVLECIDPTFEYSTGKIHYGQNNGARPLAEIFSDWGCGRVYLQEGLKPTLNKFNLWRERFYILGGNRDGEMDGGCCIGYFEAESLSEAKELAYTKYPGMSRAVKLFESSEDLPKGYRIIRYTDL